MPEVGDTLEGIVRDRRKATKFVQTYYPCSADSIALKVAGDSMVPDFHDGDIVIIDPTISPVPGDFVFVEMNDGETKLFRKYRPNVVRRGMVESYKLIPANPDWDDTLVTIDDKAIIRGVMSERVTPRRK